MKKNKRLNDAIDLLADTIDNGQLLAATDPAELLLSAVRKIKELEMNKPNKGQYHEVMDRASMMLEIWTDHITNIEVTKYEPRLKQAALEVEKKLSDFYQLSSTIEEEESKKD